MMILINNQLALFSMYLFIYFTSLHVSSNTGIPGSHLHRTIYTPDDVLIQFDSPDEHWVARNMYRREINK